MCASKRLLLRFNSMFCDWIMENFTKSCPSCHQCTCRIFVRISPRNDSRDREMIMHDHAINIAIHPIYQQQTRTNKLFTHSKLMRFFPLFFKPIAWRDIPHTIYIIIAIKFIVISCGPACFGLIISNEAFVSGTLTGAVCLVCINRLWSSI